MNQAPTGGKTFYCQSCKRDSCYFSGYSADFQLRACPKVDDIRKYADASFFLGSRPFHVAANKVFIQEIIEN